MVLDSKSIPAGDERLAGSLMNVVLKLQKNRQLGVNSTPGTPEDGARVLNAISEQKQDEQKENAPRASGTLPKEGSQEAGRQRDVGQREEESGPGQGPQVQGTEEQQRKRKMM